MDQTLFNMENNKNSMIQSNSYLDMELLSLYYGRKRRLMGKVL